MYAERQTDTSGRPDQTHRLFISRIHNPAVACEWRRKGKKTNWRLKQKHSHSDVQ